MAILNYTTTVDHFKTVGEIMQIVSKLGASDLMIRNSEAGIPDGLAFVIRVNNQPLNFRLPCNVDGVLRQLLKDPAVPKSLRTREQALRVAWRILKDWVEAQVAIIQAGLIDIPEAFFAYTLMPTGETIYKQVAGSNFKLLQ